jgi:hypothetical protein
MNQLKINMRDFIIHKFEPSNEWVTIQVNDILNDAHYIDVKVVDLAAYEDGELIQSAFPYLTSEQRELMLTGLTGDMWDEMFGDEEE